MEKLFLVDWGKDCDGARYAIIKSTEKHIGLHLDSIDLVPVVNNRSVPSLLESRNLGPVYLAIKLSSSLVAYIRCGEEV